MFTPVKYTITAFENTTLEKVLRFRDDNDNIIPLTGYTAEMQIRSSADDDTPEGIILELNTGNGGIIIDEELGKLTIYIENVLLSYIGVYDLLLFNGTKTYKPIKTSAFKVIPGVTIPT